MISLSDVRGFGVVIGGDVGVGFLTDIIVRKRTNGDDDSY